MTLEEFKKKYGTDTVGLMIDRMLFAMATKQVLSAYEYRLVDELKADIKALLK